MLTRHTRVVDPTTRVELPSSPSVELSSHPQLLTRRGLVWRMQYTRGVVALVEHLAHRCRKNTARMNLDGVVAGARSDQHEREGTSSPGRLSSAELAMRKIFRQARVSRAITTNRLAVPRCRIFMLPAFGPVTRSACRCLLHPVASAHGLGGRDFRIDRACESTLPRSALPDRAARCERRVWRELARRA